MKKQVAADGGYGRDTKGREWNTGYSIYTHGDGIINLFYGDYVGGVGDSVGKCGYDYTLPEALLAADMHLKANRVENPLLFETLVWARV